MKGQLDSVDVWKNKFNTEKDEKKKLELADHISKALCNQKPKESIQWCRKQEELAIKLNDREKLINAYLYASIAYREMAQFEEALSFNLKVIEQAEKAKDTLNMAHGYTYLGIFYHVKLDYNSAEKNYLKALDLFEKINDLNGQNSVLSNLSDVYLNTNQKKEAESCLERSIVGRKAIGNTRSIGIGYYSLGSFLLNEKKYKAGLLVLDSALAYFIKADDNYFYCQAVVLKGGGLSISGRHKESNDLLLPAVTTNVIKNNPDLLYGSYGHISRNYEKLNNVSEALKYARLEKSMSDTIFKIANLNSLSEAQAKFDTEKQEKEIELLNKEKKLSETELSRQKTIKNAFIIGSLIVIVFSVFIFRQYRAKKAAHLVISQQKTEMEKQHGELEEKQKEIVDSIRYAKRIQQTLMPTEKYIHKILKTLK